MKSQGDSSFPTDGDKATLSKLNSKSKTNKKADGHWVRINHNRSIAFERSEINNWGVCVWGFGAGGGLKSVLRCSNLTLGSVVVHIHIEVVRSSWRTSTHQWIKTANISIKIHHCDETRRVLNSKPTLKRWSNGGPTVEPRRARPKTDHQAPANLTESLNESTSELKACFIIQAYWFLKFENY